MSNQKWPRDMLDRILLQGQRPAGTTALAEEGNASALRYALLRRARSQGLQGKVVITCPPGSRYYVVVSPRAVAKVELIEEIDRHE